LHEVEEIVHESPEVQDLPAGRGEVADLGLPVRGDAVGHRFDQGQHGRKRRAQVVRDRGY